MQNFMKTILSGVQTWTKGKIKDSTADWNQNDSSADNYVKNRTHWEKEVEKEVELLSEYTISVEDWENGTYGLDWECSTELVIGQKYTITWNGITFTDLLCFDDEGYPTVGAPYKDYSEYHFGVYSYSYGDQNMLGFFTDSTEPSHTISVVYTAKETVVHKLDSKYLDLPTNLATTDDVQEAVDVASTKMDAANPVGTGSFSMNRKSGTTVGDKSHAEGDNTTASGMFSHAEGGSTTASGNYSHAEGCSNTAQCKSQHVQGEYNILDTVGSETTRGKYAHIVGNGTFDKLSNAHTLDWNGVGWFQGGLQVGGNAQDDGAQTVMLNGDKEIILASSTEGSTKKFKLSIDDTGTLTVSEIVV